MIDDPLEHVPPDLRDRLAFVGREGACGATDQLLPLLDGREQSGQLFQAITRWATTVDQPGYITDQERAQVADIRGHAWSLLTQHNPKHGDLAALKGKIERLRASFARPSA
jgi:hypothetical protein